MIDARINGDSLEVEATGMDCWPYLLQSRGARLTVRLPLGHISAARTAKPRKLFMTRHLNVPTSVAKRSRRGSFIWCRHEAPLLELRMDGQPYGHVVVSVPDPERMAAEIRSAAGVGEQ